MNNEIDILRSKIAKVQEDIAQTASESGSEKKTYHTIRLSRIFKRRTTNDGK